LRAGEAACVVAVALKGGEDYALAKEVYSSEGSIYPAKEIYASEINIFVTQTQEPK
jgi:hypothetical protein